MYLREVVSEGQVCQFCHDDKIVLYETGEKGIKAICKKCVSSTIPVTTGKISEKDIEKIKILIKYILVHTKKVRRDYNSIQEIRAFLLWRMNVADVKEIVTLKEEGVTKKSEIDIVFDDGYKLVLDPNKIHFMLLLYLGVLINK